MAKTPSSVQKFGIASYHKRSPYFLTFFGIRTGDKLQINRGFGIIFSSVMSTITTAQFRKGMFVEFKDEPHQIVEFQHVNPGKGSAFVRTRLKALKTGKVQDFTFKSGESVTEVPVATREMQFLYKEGNNYIFMDNQSYEQFTISEAMLGNYVHYLKPSDVYQVL